MSLEVKVEREDLQSYCLIFWAIFFKPLCPSGSSCSLASGRSQPGHPLHRRGAALQHRPPLAANKAEDKKKSPTISKVAQAGARQQGWGWGRGGCAEQGCGGLFSKGNPSSPSALLLAGCSVGSSFLLSLKQQKAWVPGRENPTFFSSWVHGIQLTSEHLENGSAGGVSSYHTLALILLHIPHPWQNRTYYLNFRLVFFKRDKKCLSSSSPCVSILIESKIVFYRGFYSHLRRI